MTKIRMPLNWSLTNFIVKIMVIFSHFAAGLDNDGSELSSIGVYRIPSKADNLNPDDPSNLYAKVNKNRRSSSPGHLTSKKLTVAKGEAEDIRSFPDQPSSADPRFRAPMLLPNKTSKVESECGETFNLFFLYF